MLFGAMDLNKLQDNLARMESDSCLKAQNTRAFSLHFGLNQSSQIPSARNVNCSVSDCAKLLLMISSVHFEQIEGSDIVNALAS